MKIIIKNGNYGGVIAKIYKKSLYLNDSHSMNSQWIYDNFIDFFSSIVGKLCKLKGC